MNPMSIRASQQAATSLNTPDELARFHVAGIDTKRLIHGKLLAEILLCKTVVKRLELLDLLLHYNPRFVDLGGEGEKSILQTEGRNWKVHFTKNSLIQVLDIRPSSNKPFSA